MWCAEQVDNGGTGTQSRGLRLWQDSGRDRVRGSHGRDVEAEGNRIGPGGYRAGRKWRWGWTWLNEIGGSLISLIVCGARKGSPKAVTWSIGWKPSDWSTSSKAHPARESSREAAATAAATATSAEGVGTDFRDNPGATHAARTVMACSRAGS